MIRNESLGTITCMGAPVSLPEFFETVEPSALRGRIPLILVHGIGPGQDKFYNWVRVIRHLRRSIDFNERYKIYLFAYDPGVSGPAGGHLFTTTLQRFLEREPSVAQTGYVAMTNSLGGLIFLYASQDDLVTKLCRRMISVGALYHGTPIADGDFFYNTTAIWTAVHHHIPLLLSRYGYTTYRGS